MRREEKRRGDGGGDGFIGGWLGVQGGGGGSVTANAGVVGVKALERQDWCWNIG